MLNPGIESLLRTLDQVAWLRINITSLSSHLIFNPSVNTRRAFNVCQYFRILKWSNDYNPRRYMNVFTRTSKLRNSLFDNDVTLIVAVYGYVDIINAWKPRWCTGTRSMYHRINTALIHISTPLHRQQRYEKTIHKVYLNSLRTRNKNDVRRSEQY